MTRLRRIRLIRLSQAPEPRTWAGPGDYLLHVHVMAGFEAVVGLDRQADGLLKTWLAAAITLGLLAAPCWYYRRYKTAHPDGWTRYL